LLPFTSFSCSCSWWKSTMTNMWKKKKKTFAHWEEKVVFFFFGVFLVFVW
jgi:hypothetical protein